MRLAEVSSTIILTEEELRQLKRQPGIKVFRSRDGRRAQVWKNGVMLRTARVLSEQSGGGTNNNEKEGPTEKTETPIKSGISSQKVVVIIRGEGAMLSRTEALFFIRELFGWKGG